MRMRLVLELTYPEALTPEDEAAISKCLSEVMLKLAREDSFNVERSDFRISLKVGEVAVGCAVVSDILTRETPLTVEALDTLVYGDEDGETWYAVGHLTEDEMVAAVMKWEAEVADAIDENEINRDSWGTYHVTPDPDSEEGRYQIVAPGHPKAEPMTLIRRL